MDTRSLSNVYDEIDVCIVVVVTSTRDFDISVRHSDVFCVNPQIFWCCHDSELDGSLVAESLVCPFSNGSNFLDGCDTVIGNENLDVTRRQSVTDRNCKYALSSTLVITV
jgi:hypothetical protein